MFTVLQKLHRTGLLTIPGLCRLMEGVMTTGVNMMAMLRVAARLFPRRAALTDDHGRLTYFELWQQAEALAGALHADFGIRPRQKVAIACRNHAAAVKANVRAAPGVPGHREPRQKKLMTDDFAAKKSFEEYLANLTE